MTEADPFSPTSSVSGPQDEGQLHEEFQMRRAALYGGVTHEDCDWYHTTKFPDGAVVPGEWDLRGSESSYLGGIDLRGKTVLEIGPASGYLTYWMEQQGAEVTAFEVGYGATIRVVPTPDDRECKSAEARLRDHTRRTTNAWWLLHRMTGSSAKIVHGDIYRLPKDLGSFDVVVLGCVLVHLDNPFAALREVVHHATESVVVVEQMPPNVDPSDPVIRFNPDSGNVGPSIMWWEHSPAAVSTMLERLGLKSERPVEHCQSHHGDGGSHGPVIVPMYTIVARRL